LLDVVLSRISYQFLFDSGTETQTVQLQASRNSYFQLI